MTAFFQSINLKDWPTVWSLGGRNFGGSYDSMVAGFAHTARDDFYIYEDDGSQVQVEVLARETSGVTQLFNGQYTVVSGEITRGALHLEGDDGGSFFGAFQGLWSGHGRSLQVTPGGIGIASFRSYRSCDASATLPCDPHDGNDIIGGGLMVFRLTHVAGDRANGTRIWATSNSPHTVNLQLDSFRTSLTATGFEGAPFCNEKAAPDTCGA